MQIKARIKNITLIICCFASFPAHAQVDSIKKDTLSVSDTIKQLHSNKLAFAAPIALASYGMLSFAVKPIRNLDYYIDGDIRRTAPSFSSSADNYFQYAPIAIVYGLNLVGIPGKNTFIDRTAILGISAGILEVTAISFKHATHRLRPDGSDFFSFFSGHTSAAFMGAEFLNQEYSAKSPWYGVTGYAIATTTGIFRLYNHDHWFSDVVAGAGFGILSTKAAYFVYPYIRNKLTHKKKDGRSTLIMPTYQDGIKGLSFSMQL